MAMDHNDLAQMQHNAEERIKLAARQASEGNSHVVLTETLGTFQFLEIMALARVGAVIRDRAASEGGGAVNFSRMVALAKSGWEGGAP